MSRKTRPYLFYDTTASVCAECKRRVEAKILIKDDCVYLEKWCPEHGLARSLISDDVEYYKLCREVYVKAPEMPERFNTAMKEGCPWDCGLCPDHMQHSCVSVVEITEQCNLRCPVCYAGSGPETGRHLSMAEIEAMLDTVVANEGEADVVQISGGEPTLHPDFFAVLDAARARPIRHLMVNSNGLRLAREPEFAARLAAYKPGIEVYLQFDSLRDEALMELRGATLATIHQQALEALERHNISTTLVMTVKRGVNDGEVGEVIRHGLQWRCVRGVTLQPIEDAGRNEGFDPARHRLPLSAVRRAVAEQSGVFSLDDLLPVPCNPDTLAMAYAIRRGDQLTPLTRHIAPEVLLNGPGNTISFDHLVNSDPAFKEKLFRLFATNLAPEGQASCLSDLLCCLPKIQAPDLSYENVFRVLIVRFMDLHDLDLRALKKSCVHMARPEGKMIPFETWNLFYRPL